jgi:hypothetical protein
MMMTEDTIEVTIEEKIGGETLMKTEEEIKTEDRIEGLIIQIGIKEIQAIVRHSEDIIIIETEEDQDLLIKRKLIRPKVSLEVDQNPKSKKTLT